MVPSETQVGPQLVHADNVAPYASLHAVYSLHLLSGNHPHLVLLIPIVHEKISSYLSHKVIALQVVVVGTHYLEKA